MARWLVQTAAAALVCLAAAPAMAQIVPVGDPLEDYARVLQLAGVAPEHGFSIRPMPFEDLFGSSVPEEAHPWQDVLHRHDRPQRSRLLEAGVFDPQVAVFANSTRPWGQNDGAVWQGRGLTSAVSAGVFARLGPVSAAFRPQVLGVQNSEFQTWPNQSPFEYPLLLEVIDLPQRFGPDPFTTLDLGQSYARVDVKGVAAGVSNENLWWGPGVQNAIVMSNNAPGFPHVFVGTSGATDVFVGSLQARWIWGRLDRSDYFPRETRSDSRYLTAVAIDFGPRFVPGLYIGATRAFVQYWSDTLDANDLMLVWGNLFKENTDQDRFGFDRRDQLLSVYARWVMPRSGLEVYFEHGRGDHSANLRDFVVEPQHAMGYTAGLQKVFRLAGNRLLRGQLELTKLEATRGVIVRAEDTGFFYTHSEIREGYTQRGQVLGAGIGPGSNNQHLGADLFTPRGMTGAFVRRTVYNSDRYFLSGATDNSGHEVELTAGVRASRFLAGFEVSASVAAARLLNQFYVRGNDHTNVNVALSVRRHLMGYR